ncbi:hypothetical protein [Nocardia sp. alder85J]|uniref:hypothetical protein n=1 Tax=Nocardia sp. alder85J TaxID=2862949 RepID=UPI001CD6DAB0|nr:hypothetical protein [Nocardia sp. alder85J]MCX4097515.1 hypothetical protein [Nocardia sp. alder85J]
MHRFAGWWDGFELWVAGLPFIPQFAVVLVGMIPVSFVIAYLLDRTLRIVLRLLGRDRPGSAQPLPSASAAGPGRAAFARTVRRRRQPARGGDGPGASSPRQPGGSRRRRRRTTEEAF